MPRPPLALNLRLAFLLRLFGLHSFGLPGHLFLLHFPTLPDRRQTGGDFIVDQRLRPGAQAVGQALRGGLERQLKLLDGLQRGAEPMAAVARRPMPQLLNQHRLRPHLRQQESREPP